MTDTAARHAGDFGLPSGPAKALADLERGFSSAVAGLVAHAGGGQGSATALTARVNDVATVATAADSVGLPAAKSGASVVVHNSAANSMNVFPATSDYMNGTQNASFAVAAGKTAWFFAAVDGKWFSLLSA